MVKTNIFKNFFFNFYKKCIETENYVGGGESVQILTREEVVTKPLTCSMYALTCIHAVCVSQLFSATIIKIHKLLLRGKSKL